VGIDQCTLCHLEVERNARSAAREDVRMSRLVLWWIALAASLLVVLAALVSKSGTCVDSATDAAASSCSRTGGSGGLLLLGLAAFGLSAWMLGRAYRVQRPRDPRP
jgi:hypothetical protein